MSGMGRQPFDEIVDEALQRLLDGETAEAILARYPDYADELGPLLFTAQTLKQAPQPQLPPASLAAILARAQAQAASDRKTAPIVVPPVGLDKGVAARRDRARNHNPKGCREGLAGESEDIMGRAYSCVDAASGAAVESTCCAGVRAGSAAWRLRRFTSCRPAPASGANCAYSIEPVHPRRNNRANGER